MTQTKPIEFGIEQQFVEKLSSEAFWNFVYKHSFQETNFPTKIQDIPTTLWSRDILIKMINKDNLLGNNNLTEELIETLYYLVSEHIVEHVKNEKNIIGILYTEDFQLCKNPHFSFDEIITKLKSDSDEECNYNLELKGESFLRQGDLLMRTPLPAGILLKSEPKQSGIYIPNTSRALGFNKTIVLPPLDIIPLPHNEHGYKYFCTGVFYIPTQKGSNLKWLKLIPNASAILDKFVIQSLNGLINQIKIINTYNKQNKSYLSKILAFLEGTPPKQ